MAYINLLLEFQSIVYRKEILCKVLRVGGTSKCFCGKEVEERKAAGEQRDPRSNKV
jgi:hypothetical protein